MKIVIYSDYVCPWCYIAKPAFKKSIRGRSDVEIDIRPYELRPVINGRIPQSPPIDRKKQSWENILYPTCHRVGLDNIKMPEIDPEPLTHYAHEGMYMAKEEGLSEEYHSAVLKAYFEEGKDIGSIEVLAEIAKEIGIDKEKFREALTTRKYSNNRLTDLQIAYDVVRAVPTFIIGSSVIEGYASEEEFRDAIERAKDINVRK